MSVAYFELHTWGHATTFHSDKGQNFDWAIRNYNSFQLRYSDIDFLSCSRPLMLCPMTNTLLKLLAPIDEIYVIYDTDIFPAFHIFTIIQLGHIWVHVIEIIDNLVTFF